MALCIYFNGSRIQLELNIPKNWTDSLKRNLEHIHSVRYSLWRAMVHWYQLINLSPLAYIHVMTQWNLIPNFSKHVVCHATHAGGRGHNFGIRNEFPIASFSLPLQGEPSKLTARCLQSFVTQGSPMACWTSAPAQVSGWLQVGWRHQTVLGLPPGASRASSWRA